MSKKPSKKNAVTKNDILKELNQAMIEGGFRLPTEPEEISDEDMELYGKGDLQTFESLQDITTRVHKRIESLLNKEGGVVTHSPFAMAARNGKNITKDILEKMRLDRIKDTKGNKDIE